MYSSMTDPGRAYPLSTRFPFTTAAELRIGKFSRPLPPASPSPASLSVANGALPKFVSSLGELRSMPICPVGPEPSRPEIVPLSRNELWVRRVPLEPSFT
jgi:hypothetical protein